jgi:hypothetical protein
MTRRRLILYLLLNALVTVLVAWAVLYYYNRSNPRQDCSLVEQMPTLASATVRVDILSVSGTGALASEAVTIQNQDDAAITLTGWTLKNSQGDSYTFPEVTLYPDAIVRVHSGSGDDTPADLYWQLSASVWKSGQLVALYDPQNIARAFYRVP